MDLNLGKLNYSFKKKPVTKPMFKIRNYQKNDFPQVIKLIQESELFDLVWDTEENINGMFERDPELLLVAEADGQIVGNLFLISYGTKVTFLFRLAVKSGYRKKGIATELLHQACDIVKARGGSEVGLLVDADNRELQGYYEKRGYKRSKKSYFYMFKGLS